MSAPQLRLFGTAPPARPVLSVCPARATGSMDAVVVDEADWENTARAFVQRERRAAHAYRIDPDGSWLLVHSMDATGTVTMRNQMPEGR